MGHPCRRGLCVCGLPTTGGRKPHRGSGYLGLIPKTSMRGNRGSKLPEESRALLDSYIEQNYETLKQKSKFAVWAALLHACDEKGIVAPSYVTFCPATRLRPSFESVLKRKGRRAAYTHEPFYWELEPTTPRHGDRPFEIGHIDHTELDVELGLFTHRSLPRAPLDDFAYRRVFTAVPCTLSGF